MKGAYFRRGRIFEGGVLVGHYGIIKHAGVEDVHYWRNPAKGKCEAFTDAGCSLASQTSTGGGGGGGGGVWPYGCNLN